VSDRRRIAVDFDNTITNGDVDYWDGELPTVNDDVREKVLDLYHRRHTIIVWTARPWSQASDVAGHLTRWGIKYHGIRCSKGSADLYVDDKAVHVDDWVDEDDDSVVDNALKEITTLEEALDDANV
jgi:hypothetical protein